MISKEQLLKAKNLIECGDFVTFFMSTSFPERNEYFEFFSQECGIECLRYMNEIPSYLFQDSKASRIDIPENVRKINAYAFSQSSTEEVYVPNSVKYIGQCAFDKCPDLTILCNEGSYVETYAQENEIPYKIV